MAHRAFRQEAGSETLAYAFAGEAFDSTTNLAYHRARWMDSRVGRFTGMDRDDGVDTIPLSLHTYIYGNDEPADLTDPMGTTALQGIFVHEYIGADFVSYGDYAREGLPRPHGQIILPAGTYGTLDRRLSNSWLSSVLNIFGSGRQRPDLTDKSTHEIWEIKQDDDVKSGLSDLIYYISLLEARGGALYHPGTSYQPPTVVPMGTNYADVWVADPGLIVYHIYGNTENQESVKKVLQNLFGFAMGGEGVMAP